MKPAIGNIFKINYKNYRGEIATREILIRGFCIGSNEYHKEHQLLINAVDLERNVDRVFAAKDVLKWYKDGEKDYQ